MNTLGNRRHLTIITTAVLLAVVIFATFAAVLAKSASGATPTVGWDPCSPITYSVTGQGTSKRMKLAMARVTAVTGVRFERVRRDAELSIRFYPDATGDPNLAGDAATAYEEPTAMAPDSVGRQHWTAAEVVVNRGLLLGRYTWSEGVTVLMHELGHVMGLDHTDDPTQVMYEGALVGLDRSQWGAGDLANFRALYPVNNCCCRA